MRPVPPRPQLIKQLCKNKLVQHASIPYEGYRLNVAGMLAASELMLQHAAQRRLSYSVALRLRVDIGSRRIMRLINGTLSAEAWRGIRDVAASPGPASRVKAKASRETAHFFSCDSLPIVPLR